MTYAATASKNSGPMGGSVAANFGAVDIETSGIVNAGSLKVAGTSINAANASLADVNATADELNQLVGITTGTVPYGLPLSTARAYNAWKDALGDTPTGGVLGLADTVGSVAKSTASNGDSQDDAAVFLFPLPNLYVSGAAITVRIRAKKDTTAGTVADKVDLVAKLVGDTLGSELCTTAAQSITTSYANYDFTVDPTGLVAGDILALEVHGITDDTGGATNKAVFISRVEVRLALT